MILFSGLYIDFFYCVLVVSTQFVHFGYFLFDSTFFSFALKMTHRSVHTSSEILTVIYLFTNFKSSVYSVIVHQLEQIIIWCHLNECE